MNKRKRMIVKAKTQMIINADTLEESGWYRRMIGENRATNKLIELMVTEFLEVPVRLSGKKATERKMRNEQSLWYRNRGLET